MTSGGGVAREDLLALRPPLAERLAQLHEAIWSGPVSPVTLELCRLRMATLLANPVARDERSPAAVAAGLGEDLVAALPSWPTNPAFTAEHRACLALAEQWVLDAQAVTDAEVQAVVDALGPEGAVLFTTALGVWDGQHRFDNALGVSRAGGS